MRAGKLTLGADMVIAAMQKRAKSSSELVLVSAAASDATKARLAKKCTYYETELIELPIDMEELGRMLGKTYAPAVISVNDKGFSTEIKRLYELCISHADGEQA